MFAEHTMKHIVTPTFPLQSQYDEWQIMADLGIRNKDGSMPVAPAQTVLINEHVNTQLRARPRAFFVFFNTLPRMCTITHTYPVSPYSMNHPMLGEFSHCAGRDALVTCMTHPRARRASGALLNAAASPIDIWYRFQGRWR
jgi:hypothetical protein